MISSLDHVAMIPMKGRDVQFETQRTTRRGKSELDKLFETPQLPFEKNCIKKKAARHESKTSLKGSLIDRTPKNSDGIYSIRFKDSTWKSTSVNNRDAPPKREDVKGLITNYKKDLALIAGYKGVDLATQTQAVNDSMLEELINQLRVIDLGQAELLEMSRKCYADVFSLLFTDAASSREMILKLKEETKKAQFDKNNAINQCNVRIQEIEDDANHRISEMKQELDKKMEEYDEDMRNFLDQKQKLEDHVKALHHVFLDFQSDAVYLKLEEIKQQAAKAQARLVEKDDDITRLQMSIQKWKIQCDELNKKLDASEEANNTLRDNLRQSQMENAQLKRRIEELSAELYEDDSEGEDQGSSLMDEVDKLISEKKNQDELEKKSETIKSDGPVRFGRVHRFRKSLPPASFNSVPFIDIYQKLGSIEMLLTEFIGNISEEPLETNYSDDSDEVNGTKLMSGNPDIAFQVLTTKTEQISKYCRMLNNSKPSHNIVFSQKQPRFLQFFSYGIGGKPPMKTEGGPNIYSTIRRIFQTKYMSDKWAIRGGRRMSMFPDYVLSYFYEEEGKMSFALHDCKKLWEELEKNESTECRLFKKFLTEEYCEDEVSFFLQIRTSLLGLLPIQEEEDEKIRIPMSKCISILEELLGSFADVIASIKKQIDKRSEHGVIDYADFLECLLNYYGLQRKQRADAVKIMVESKKFDGSLETPIFVELFVSMMMALGFTGSLEELLRFYRYSQILGGGEATTEGILKAMDELSIHFYSIDTPLEKDFSIEQTESERVMINDHWVRFSQWFDGLRSSNKDLNTWAKSLLTKQLRKVDQSFQYTLPVGTMYYQLRELYDNFQFILSIITRGAQKPIDKDTSEMQLKIMERLITTLMEVIVETKAS